jgi:hypothetical protein
MNPEVIEIISSAFQMVAAGFLGAIGGAAASFLKKSQLVS